VGGPALETEVAKGGHLAVLPNGRLVVGIGDLDDQEPRFGTRWPPGAEPARRRPPTLGTCEVADNDAGVRTLRSPSQGSLSDLTVGTFTRNTTTWDSTAREST
jgi:hypothetical protein